MNKLRYLELGSSRHAVLLIALVLLFLIFGYPKLMGFSGTVQYMASVSAPLPVLSAVIAVVMEVLVAILIILGFYTRPLALVFMLYTLGTAIIGHHYWNMPADAVTPNMINFYKNISIAAAFLLLAACGPGAYSLDKR
ncbi:DoxX family protein [Erwinia sp. HR93]|uniref:DoxX family protein n=1 Tax=Erwinia sp. HR93 TaxID=3094840 RepID=UPI002ADEEFCE|nr:DoxX family protein [Erwinia sp. HR93]MEA1064324.1 DoxX family protein [Erwinia sp. HR93]